MEERRKSTNSGSGNRPSASGKGYTPPKVIYEGKLEVRAGSPIGRMPGMEFLDPASPLYEHDK
jgi:hypothetical protein